MAPHLSVPVVWVEDDAAPLAGRLDLLADRIHLDGGPHTDRHRRDVAFAEIESVRIARENGARIKGRAAIVLSLVGGGLLSFAGLDRPGTQLELLHQLQSVVS